MLSSQTETQQTAVLNAPSSLTHCWGSRPQMWPPDKYKWTYEDAERKQGTSLLVFSESNGRQQKREINRYKYTHLFSAIALEVLSLLKFITWQQSWWD